MPSMKSEREELAGLSDHLRSQAEKFDQLKKLLEDLEAGNYSEEVLKECPDVAAKLVEKEKLLYRLNIMKRAIAESPEQKNLMDLMK
uniref:Uncharacterized protein n=1 Tax=Ditylenchus dipsaci TaxID=166011 RepID=A0A915EJ86_9BILA